MKDSGTRSGCCSKKWIRENIEYVREYARKGGKVGGKMSWWNNGIINKKSFESPGIEWNKRMLMSEKKRKQVYECLAGHNRKDSK